METMPDTATIAQARDFVHEHRIEGVRCPCCGEMRRIYRRRVTRAQVLFLRDLVRESVRRHAGTSMGLVDVREIEGQHMRGGDYAKLKHWGLAFPDAKDPGWWHLSAKGLTFLRGSTRIPKHLWIDGNEVVRESPEDVDVHDCYRERFVLPEIFG